MISGSRKLVLLASLFAATPALGADLAVLHNGFTISHERREVIGSVTRLYITGDGRGYADVPTEQIDHFETDLTPPKPLPAPAPQAVLQPQKPASPDPITLDQVVATFSGRQHLDPDLVNSVIHAESGFKVRAVSPKGALGLMQLMPGTASSLGVRNAFDPQANVDGGTRYLRTLLEQYNFDLAKALAAYNAGPQRVAQYRGVPPYYETRAYVARIIRDFNRKKLAEQLAEKKNAAAAAKTATAAKPARARPAKTVQTASTPHLTPQASR